MKWQTYLQYFLGGSLMMAQTLNPHILHSTVGARPGPTMAHPVRVDEVLSYICARSIATLVMGDEQRGPLFFEGRLAFTSVVAQDNTLWLVMNAGSGNYAVALEGSGVNRIRFHLPTGLAGSDQTYFLSYYHGGWMRSRVFEFGEGHAPLGRDELDFNMVTASRADQFLPSFEYAIHETAESTVNAVIEGRLNRAQVNHHAVEDCDHFSRSAPDLARQLRRNLELLDMLVAGANPRSEGAHSPHASASEMGRVRTPASL